MSRNVRDPNFMNELIAQGGLVTDHAHAFAVLENFLQIDENNDLLTIRRNAPFARSVMGRSVQNIRNAFGNLSENEQNIFLASLDVMESDLNYNIATYQHNASTGLSNATIDAIQRNTFLLTETTQWRTLLAEQIIPALQGGTPQQNTQTNTQQNNQQITPPQNAQPNNAPALPNAPTNLFVPGDVDQLQWILSPQVKGAITHGAFDHFFRDYIGTPAILAQINAIYTQMWSAVRATPLYDAQGNILPCPLINTPLIDLGIILGERSPLPTEKNKLQPLYTQIRGIWQRYENACDMNHDNGVYTDSVTTNVPLTNTANQLLFTPGNYVHTDNSIHNLNIPVLDRSRGAPQCTYLDDQNRDCKRFFTTNPVTGDYQLVGGHVQFNTEAFQREYPDAKSITVTRPMLLSGDFIDSGITIPFDGIKTSFVDIIKFSKLNVATRTDNLNYMYAPNDPLDTPARITERETARETRSALTTALGGKTQEIATHLNNVLRTSYDASDHEHISAALRDVVPTPNLTFDEINENAIYGTTPVNALDRIVTAILSKKLADCRTEDEYHAIVQGFKTNPDSLVANLSNVPRAVFDNVRAVIDTRIGAVPRGNVVPVGFVAGLVPVNVAGVLGSVNTPLPHAPSNYLDFGIVTRAFDRVSNFFRKSNLAEAEATRDKSKKVTFVELRDIDSYCFLLGIGDHHGESVEETISLQGSTHTFSDIKKTISIQSASLIDYDFTIPAQGGFPEFIFDGQRGTPEMIRAQLDAECAGRDRKLVHNSKLYFETELLKRLEAQNGDISARFDDANICTVSTNAKGVIIVTHKDTTVIPPLSTTYAADACNTGLESQRFIDLVRRVMDGHVETARTLLLNGETDKYAALADFPTLSTIEKANGTVPDDYPLEREETKDFGGVTVKVGYKMNEDKKYKLCVEDTHGVEEFDSIGEVVLSDKNRFIGLDLMHRFHEKLLDHFLANRKTLPNDRAYVIEDPISGDYYGIYQVGTKIHYGKIGNDITGYHQEDLTNEQRRQNVITDPKRRCLMLRMPVRFEKGSDDLAKKTICGRKDLFYSLIFGAMSTSLPGPNEKKFVAEQNKKSKEESGEFMKTLGDVGNLVTLGKIIQDSFTKTAGK